MIEFVDGNILKADAEALVNTVNCVGVMGKGIALQFKQAYPDNCKAYERACKAGEVEPGRMFIFSTGFLKNPRYLINFPTKRHWRGKSRIEDIESGLGALVREIEDRGIESIAVPPLGCGNGGLDWRDVRPMIEDAFAALPEVRVLLFAPGNEPALADRPINTARPKLTLARAMYIKLMDRYAAMEYNRSLLELQKLAYFLQESGQELRLRFVEGPYGPYADNLNKVLELFEGHYTCAYVGSRAPDAKIELLAGAIGEADEFLADHPKALLRLERVSRLIQGFETPYGMELLATVHWVATKRDVVASNVDTAIERLQSWSSRKKRLFQPEHAGVAWDRLQAEGWISANQ